MKEKIKLHKRKAKSHDPKFKYYPEWYLTFEDEDTGKFKRCSPSYRNLISILGGIVLHELKVDISRGRKIKDGEYYSEKINKVIENVLEEIKKLNVDDIKKEYAKYNEVKI